MSKGLREKKTTDAMRIFEALSGVDEELLARCEKRKNRSLPYYGRVLAACFCLVVCGAVLWSAGSLVRDTSNSAGSAARTEEMAQDMELAVEQGENMTGAEASEKIASGLTADQSLTADTGNTNGAAQEASGVAEAAVEEGLQVQEHISNTENYSGSQKQQGEGDNLQADAGLPYTGEEITLAEARETDLLGEYVPGTLPSGYTLEAAYRERSKETGEVESIVLCWAKGMDSIHWTISWADAAEIATADISKPETYDVNLYEIPYGETVPEEYRAVFNNPVFAEADFSLDIVKSRMKTVSDSGDTDTPRGCFSVLYESGVLVKFNGRGAAESIYKMFP